MKRRGKHVNRDKHTETDFRWGIWGTGTIAAAFAGDIQASTGMRVTAVCSRASETAETFQRRIGADKAFNDSDAFLSDADIDAIYIATPSAMHVLQAMQAIAADKPCLIEKPLSLDAAGARQIEAAAKAKNVFAMEAMWSRFLPAIRAAKQHIDSGRIGTVTRIEAELSYIRAYDPQSRFFSLDLGGGAAFDLGVYPISLALYFLGLPEHVDGRWQRAKSGVDMRTEFQLGWQGATASLSCGFDRDGDNRVLIEGTGGTILIHAPFLKAQRLTLFSAFAARSSLGPNSGKGVIGKIMNRLPLPGRTIETYAFSGNGLQFQAEAVRDAVRSGQISNATMPLDQSAAVADIVRKVLAKG
nr:Gfo/Idh/MocA family oxidoreductase [Brucella cytisi]